ncbi:hypothetical protein HY416_00155 [Candidatus Kaiserbacteria bacterium]|nr:hypothetical protein [Candidatus Kaiserbacteria bacterium]
MKKVDSRSFFAGSIFCLLLWWLIRVAVGADQGWRPWFVKKVPQSREAFARAIETDDRTMLRVPAGLFAATWGGRGMDLPVGPDPASWGSFLRSSEVTEVACTPELLRTLFLARVRPDIGEVDFALEREACLPGEMFLAWRGTPFVSLGCGNPVRLRVPRPPASPAVPPTTTVVVPPHPPPPPVAECVELHSFYRGKVVFPTIEDRPAWFHCNPWSDCVVDCLDWVSGRNARPFPRLGSDAARSQQEAARVRELTGQGSRGGHAALEGATMMPVSRHGPTVFCKKGTHEYWVLWPDGRVTKGLD